MSRVIWQARDPTRSFRLENHRSRPRQREGCSVMSRMHTRKAYAHVQHSKTVKQKSSRAKCYVKESRMQHVRYTHTYNTHTQDSDA